MNEIVDIKRVFISYSKEDASIAETLANDLQNDNLNVWIDFVNIVPGTSDWEFAIREAIEKSFAFILIATPSSLKSQFVRSEILLAQAKNISLFVLWAKGENWIESIPMSLSYIQYIDIRADAYQTNYAVIQSELSKHHIKMPPHFIYKSYYIKISEGDKIPLTYHCVGSVSGEGFIYYIYRKSFPQGYLEIKLGDHFDELRHQNSLDSIFINPLKYRSANQLIDEIYLNYFQKTFPPFTYGVQWFLKSCGSVPQVIIPWKYVFSSKKETSAISYLNEMSEKPEFYGLKSGMQYILSKGKPYYLTVIAVNEDWISKVVINNIKAIYFLREKVLQEYPVGKFNETKYKRIIVLTDLSFNPQDYDKKLLIQTELISVNDKADLQDRFPYYSLD